VSDTERRLREILGSEFLRPAGAADEVAGVPARWVARPGTVDTVVEVLQLAAERDLTVVPCGAGTKIDWGWSPPHVDVLLDTGRLAGVQLGDGDVVEVDAGTPVRGMQANLAGHKRRVSIDVRSAGATVGGVVATDEAGPLRLSQRDPLTAVSYVDASGVLTRVETSAARSASEVDRLRMCCEPERPQVVLVSAAFRVQPVPEKQVWVSYPVRELPELSPMVSMIISGAAPDAIEVDLPPVDVPGKREIAGTLTVLLEGDRSEVAERQAMLARSTGRAAHLTATAPRWWLRYPFEPGNVALRIEIPTEYLFNVALSLYDVFHGAVAIRGSAGLGVLYAGLPANTEPKRVTRALEGLRHVLHSRRGRCLVVAAPPAVRREIDPWDLMHPVPLLHRLVEGLDPDPRSGLGHLPGGG